MTRARHPRGAQIAALTPIVRRLHLQELQRVRRDAARAAAVEAENERLRDEVSDAHGRSDMLHRALMQVEDIQLGLTMGAQLLVAQAGGVL